MAKGHSINDEIKEQKKKFKRSSLSESFSTYQDLGLIIAAVIAVILVIASFFVHIYETIMIQCAI